MIAFVASLTWGLIPAHAGKTRHVKTCEKRRWAHPRSRGENRRNGRVVAGLDGSSPLTRGKPRPQGRQARRQGLIPAHAGKTRAARRGDDLHGLIPAHAGKTGLAGDRRGGGWAHPRSRGENSGARRCRSCRSGSSPLTRGKRTPGGGRGAASRAHPRSRGENEVVHHGSGPFSGSSPLTRGKLSASVLDDLVAGLIPAHAGKTREIAFNPAATRAHPRSRGENVSGPSRARGGVGSSPLTRGKHIALYTQAAERRLIPAHAGKTFGRRQASLASRAHPRSRGENNPQQPHLEPHQGSSPLTRGKPPAGVWASAVAGLIPAHAGKT